MPGRRRRFLNVARFVLLVTSLVVWTCGRIPASAAGPTGHAAARQARYERSGLVNDYAHVLTLAEIQRLQRAAAAFRSAEGVDVVVVTLPDLGGRSIEAVSIELAREWGVGATTGRAGLLVLLVLRERQSRIEVSRNLEAMLTDAECRQILVSARGASAKGEYGNGLAQTLAAIRAQLPRPAKGGVKRRT